MTSTTTTTNDVVLVVRKIKSIPTLPQVVTQLMQAVNNPNASASDVSKIIANDQALTSKILRIVNSAFYGLPKRISTVTQATVILGFNTVKNLALSASVFDAFDGGNVQSGKWDRKKFWEHSIGCAVATKLLAREIRYTNPEEAFVAGLLHDIGKVVIDQYFNDQFAQILEMAESDGLSFSNAERAILGITHADVGRWLADNWNLPLTLNEAIALHHEPTKARHAARLVCLVHLGDSVVRMEKVGYSGDDQAPEIDSAIWDVLRLPPEAMERVLGNFHKEFERSSVFLELANGE